MLVLNPLSNRGLPVTKLYTVRCKAYAWLGQEDPSPNKQLSQQHPICFTSKTSSVPVEQTMCQLSDTLVVFPCNFNRFPIYVVDIKKTSEWSDCHHCCFFANFETQNSKKSLAFFENDIPWFYSSPCCVLDMPNSPISKPFTMPCTKKHMHQRGLWCEVELECLPAFILAFAIVKKITICLGSIPFSFKWWREISLNFWTANLSWIPSSEIIMCSWVVTSFSPGFM